MRPSATFHCLLILHVWKVIKIKESVEHRNCPAVSTSAATRRFQAGPWSRKWGPVVACLSIQVPKPLSLIPSMTKKKKKVYVYTIFFSLGRAIKAFAQNSAVSTSILCPVLREESLMTKQSGFLSSITWGSIVLMSFLYLVNEFSKLHPSIFSQ